MSEPEGEATNTAASVLGVHPLKTRTPCVLIEILLTGVAGPFAISAFTQEKPGIDRAFWQAPYEPKLLDPEGAAVLADVLMDSRGRPELWRGTVRLVFFFHLLDTRKPLESPFGPLQLPAPTPRPDRLKFLRYVRPD